MSRKYKVTIAIALIVGAILNIGATSVSFGTGNGRCPVNYGLTAPTGLYLYEHTNYYGRYIRILPYSGASDLSKSWWAFNDIASSLCVVGPYRFQVCEHANFSGACSTFSYHDPDLRDNGVGNDRASSVIWK
jgi:hypothetical protein